MTIDNSKSVELAMARLSMDKSGAGNNRITENSSEYDKSSAHNDWNCHEIAVNVKFHALTIIGISRNSNSNRISIRFNTP